MVPMNVDVSSAAAVDEERRYSSEAMAIAATRSETRRDLVLNPARAEMIRRLVGELKPVLNLANALDVGCGTGSGAQAMQGCGLYVRGFDARMKNIIAARERFREFHSGRQRWKIPTSRGWERSTWCCAWGCCSGWRIRCWRSGTCAR